MTQGRGQLRVPARGSQGRATPPSHCCPCGSQLCLLAPIPALWAGDGPWQHCVPMPCLSSCHHCLALQRALSPAVLTILPPMALMCCCSVSQCLSCGSAAYCNKAARTELRTGDRPSPKIPLLRDSAPGSVCPAPASALALANPLPTPLACALCASQTLGMCSKITNKGMGEEVNKGAEAHTPNSHGKPSGCGT